MADEERDRNIPESSRETEEERTTDTTPQTSGEPATSEPPVTRHPSTPQGHPRATATQRMEEETPTWQPGAQPETEERAVERARSTAEEALGAAQEQAKSALATQKGQAAESLTDVAQAIRRTTDDLRQQEHEGIARYAERLAAQVDNLSDTLRTKSVDDMLSDVQRYAHQQPEVFVGGAFVLGLLAARFLKSSSRGYSEQPAGQRGYEERLSTPGYGGSTYSRPASTPYGGQAPTSYGGTSSETGTHPPESERHYE